MKKILSVAAFIKKHYTYLFLGLISFGVVLGFFNPTPGKIILGQVGHMMTIAVFLISMNISVKDFRAAFQFPKAVFMTLALNFILMPLLYWLLGEMLISEPVFIVGLIMVGFSPVAVNSSVYTALLDGNASISLSSNAISMLLTILILPPIASLVSGTEVAVNVSSLYQNALTILLIPMTLGISIRHFFFDRIKSVQPLFPIFSGSIILAVAFSIGNANIPILVEQADMIPRLILASCLAIPIGFFLSYFISRRSLSIGDSIPATFSGVMKNMSVAVGFAVASVSEAATIPIVLATIAQVIFGISLFRIIQKKQILQSIKK